LVPTDAQLLNNSEAVTALRAKQREQLLLGVGRIAVAAQSTASAVALLRRVEAPWHGTRAPGVQLMRRLVFSKAVVRRVRMRSVPLLGWPAVLNTEEAAGLIGWPVGVLRLPGLDLSSSRLLPVAPAIPTAGTVVGLSNFPGSRGQPVALDLNARYRHLTILGPTGTGKSTVMARLILDDISAGHSVIVLDPKNDLVDAVAERLPEDCLERVLILDLADDDFPVGYNPLACTPDTRELVVEQILGVLRAIWRSSWGPRSDDIVRACLLTLSAAGDFTMAELAPLLTDAAFRASVLERVDDPYGVAQFWANFHGWSPAERTTAIAPVLNKARALTMRARLRRTLGQQRGGLDFNRAVANREIVLIRLAAGRLGTEAAYLVGALLFAGLWDAVSARAGQPITSRQPVMAHLDEFQHLVVLPTPADTVLAEARGYGLGLTLAHQHLGQLDSKMEQAVRANARSKLVFQTSQHDATVLARELGGGLTAEDLQGLGAHEAVVACFAGGTTQPPATITTLPLGEPLREASVVFEQSRRRWGVPRAEVDDQIAQRQGAGRSTVSPVGRRRRTS